jgi:hypothetical protein
VKKKWYMKIRLFLVLRGKKGTKTKRKEKDGASVIVKKLGALSL